MATKPIQVLEHKGMRSLKESDVQEILRLNRNANRKLNRMMKQNPNMPQESFSKMNARQIRGALSVMTSRKEVNELKKYLTDITQRGYENKERNWVKNENGDKIALRARWNVLPTLQTVNNRLADIRVTEGNKASKKVLGRESQNFVSRKLGEAYEGYSAKDMRTIYKQKDFDTYFSDFIRRADTQYLSQKDKRFLKNYRKTLTETMNSEIADKIMKEVTRAVRKQGIRAVTEFYKGNKDLSMYELYKALFGVDEDEAVDYGNDILSIWEKMRAFE